MLEQHRHLANKYEDTVNLQGAGHIVADAHLQLVTNRSYWTSGKHRLNYGK